MSWYKYLILITVLLIFPQIICAEITINEVYPAPKDGEFEWIELYNPDDVSIPTEQYVIKDLTGKPMTFNSSSIAPHSYALATSSALLNNKDETIFLTKKSGESIQSLTYSVQFDSEKSYSNCSSQWVLSPPTKILENMCISPTPTIAPSPTVPETSSDTTDTSSATNYDNIFINEVMAAPETGTKEWIELFNNNDFPVTLEGWYIDSHKVSTSITAKGYSVIEMSSTTFTNSGDTIQFFDSNKTLKDTFSYSYTEKNSTWGRSSSDFSSFCLQQSSKGGANSACISTTNTSSQSSSKTATKASSSGTQTSSNKNSSTIKKETLLYAGVISQINSTLQIETGESKEEKEYKVSGYKTATEPTLVLLSAYGFYVALCLSLLAFTMIVVKMKKYFYEKDALTALAVVTTLCINGYYLHSLFTTRYTSI